MLDTGFSSQPPKASRDPPIFSGQDQVQWRDRNCLHIVVLYNAEGETRVFKDTANIQGRPYPLSSPPPIGYQVSSIVQDFILSHGVGRDGPVDHCWLPTSSIINCYHGNHQPIIVRSSWRVIMRCGHRREGVCPFFVFRLPLPYLTAVSITSSHSPISLLSALPLATPPTRVSWL